MKQQILQGALDELRGAFLKHRNAQTAGEFLETGGEWLALATEILEDDKYDIFPKKAPGDAKV